MVPFEESILNRRLRRGQVHPLTVRGHHNLADQLPGADDDGEDDQGRRNRKPPTTPAVAKRAVSGHDADSSP